MKKPLIKFIPGLLIILVILTLGLISVSASVSYTNSSGSAKLVCGSYKKTFTAKKYGKNFSAALNAALYAARSKAKSGKPATVTVSKGYYKLDRTIIVYSNTKLNASGSYFRYYGNLLRNGFDKNKTAGYGYNSAKNITIKGGEWEQLIEYKYAGTLNTSIMHSTFRFAHCKNIKVNNAAFKNNYNCHDVEIAGVKDADISGNNFYNKKSVNGIQNDGGRESVQIDVNTASAMPYFPSYDKTSCRNINIHDNTFKNKFRAIGSHHAVIGNAFSNINVYNNKMDNIAGIAVYAVYWTNSKIYGNTMNNVGFGIDIRSMINNPVALNYYNLNKLTYQKSEQVTSKFKSYIYDNKIKIRDKDNILTKPCGIRANGDYYSKDNSETGTKAGVYRIYNVNIGVDSSGNSKPNTVTGNFAVGIQMNYGVNSTIKNNIINLNSGAFKTSYGVELRGCEGVSVSSNTLKNGKSSSAKGIYVYESPSNTINSTVKITNNNISNFNYAGISVQKTDAAFVKNNSVKNCAKASLIMKSTVNAQVSGNHLSGGTYGAYLSDYPNGVDFNSNKVSGAEYGIYMVNAGNITAEKNSFKVSVSGARVKSSSGLNFANNIVNSGKYGVVINNDCDNTVINKNKITSVSNCVYYNGSSSSDKTAEKNLAVTDNALDCAADVPAVRIAFENVFANIYNNYRSDGNAPIYRYKGNGETKYSGYSKTLALDSLSLETADSKNILSWSTSSKPDGYRVYLNDELKYDTAELSCVLKNYKGESISVVPYKSFGSIKLGGLPMYVNNQ